MKKIISLTLCLILCLSLFACNVEKTTAESTKESQQTENTSSSATTETTEDTSISATTETTENTQQTEDTSSSASTETTATTAATVTTEPTDNNGTQEEPKKYFLPEGYDVLMYINSERLNPKSKIKAYDPEYGYGIPDDFTPPESINFAIGENTYTATYTGFAHVDREYGPEYSYRDDAGNIFKTNEKQELVYLDISDKNQPQLGPIISQEEFEKRALDFLIQITGSSNYKMVSSEDLDSECYRINFKKHFNDIPAFDSVWLLANRDGFIYYLRSEQFNRVPDDLKIPSIDMDKVYSAIDYAFYSLIIHDYTAKYKDIKFEIRSEPELFALRNGEAALICEYRVDYRDGVPMIKDDPNSDSQMHDIVRLVIKIPQTQ